MLMLFIFINLHQKVFNLKIYFNINWSLLFILAYIANAGKSLRYSVETPDSCVWAIDFIEDWVFFKTAICD